MRAVDWSGILLGRAPWVVGVTAAMLPSCVQGCTASDAEGCQEHCAEDVNATDAGVCGRSCPGVEDADDAGPRAGRLMPGDAAASEAGVTRGPLGDASSQLCVATAEAPGQTLVDCGANVPRLRLEGEFEGEECEVSLLAPGRWQLLCGANSAELSELEPVVLVVALPDTTLLRLQVSQDGSLRSTPFAAPDGGDRRVKTFSSSPDGARFVFSTGLTSSCPGGCGDELAETLLHRVFVADFPATDAEPVLHELPIEPLGASSFALADRGRLLFVETADGVQRFDLLDDGPGEPVSVDMELPDIPYSSGGMSSELYRGAESVDTTIVYQREKEVWVAPPMRDAARLTICGNCQFWLDPTERVLALVPRGGELRFFNLDRFPDAVETPSGVEPIRLWPCAVEGDINGGPVPNPDEREDYD